MKTLKLIFSLLIIAALSCYNTLGQTYQKELHTTVEGVEALCGLVMKGNWTVHCTYHLDPQTGKIDRMHFNIPNYEIWNTLSGVRYELIDTGNDNIGWWWGFWNDMTGAGLSLPADGELPDEGKAVGTFKVISKGGDVYSYSILYQLHRDASGNITVEKFKEIWDCN